GLTGNYTTFVLISLLIFYSLGHAHLAEGLEARSGEAEAKPDETAKEKFKPEQIQALTLLMENEKPYLQPALTLEKLATQLQMPTRSLSNMINRQFSCNFFEFINAYRIDEAKRLLSEPGSVQKNMLDIMYEVGFNSKATFNTLFKKKLGMTPSEYRKLANAEAVS